MALPGQAGRNYASMTSGSRAGLSRLSNRPQPSAAKSGVFAASPSAAKSGVFAKSPYESKFDVNKVLSTLPQKSDYSGVMAMSPRGAQEASMAEYTRQKFFDSRPDITRDRLERRRLQEEEYNRFKQTQMKPVTGASNLYQSVTPGGPTLADEAMRLANIYGPTPSEIYGDIKYGMGQFGKAIAEKGTPLMNLLKSIYGGVQNFFTPAGGQGTTAQGPLSGLTQGQISSYNQLIALGMDPQIALAQVTQRYALGGIASLN